MKQVKHFDHLNMTVRNLQESLEWYRRVFGFTLVESGERDLGPWAIVRSGEAMLCLYERAGRTYEIPYGDGPHHGICHFAIRITDREEWASVLESEEVEVEFGGAQDWPHSTSWYLRDPTGYQIEVVYWHHDEICFAA
jgi:catechol 2,3-dioxygenase-like lactoylglutathione lyase family enzyme